MKKLIFILTALAFLSFRNQSQTVVDYDGNIYDTVIIGPHTWLKPNLRVTHYNDGTPIPNVADSAQWAELTSGARCYYNNDSIANDSVYGPLYNWYAAANSKNICPAGWHLSSNAEWIETENYLGGGMVAGGKMKEAGTLHWLSPNSGATNSSGFTGLPGGGRDPLAEYLYLHENGLWWTSTIYNSSSAWSTYLWYMNSGVDHNPTPKRCGFSIRCIKDVETGLEGGHSPGKINVFPNPATGRITIEYAAGKGTALFIYDFAGKLLLQTILTMHNSNIDISFLPEGVYFLRLSNDQELIQRKLIKK